VGVSALKLVLVAHTCSAVSNSKLTGGNGGEADYL